MELCAEDVEALSRSVLGCVRRVLDDVWVRQGGE